MGTCRTSKETNKDGHLPSCDGHILADIFISVEDYAEKKPLLNPTSGCVTGGKELEFKYVN